MLLEGAPAFDNIYDSYDSQSGVGQVDHYCGHYFPSATKEARWHRTKVMDPVNYYDMHCFASYSNFIYFSYVPS